jgi:uncharacterized protein YggE
MRIGLGFVILGVLALASAARAEMIPVRTITVTGIAERKVTPDEAHIYVTLSATNFKLAEAKTAHDGKLNKLFAIAQKNGIDRKNLSTQSSTVQPEYDYINGKQSFKGHRVQTQIDMKLVKSESLATVTEQLLSSGLEEKNQEGWSPLFSSNYVISNPDKIRDEMLADAVKNAREKAENIARATNSEITRVYQVNEGDVPSFARPPVMAMMRAASAPMTGADAAPSPQLPAGEQEMRASVTVTYELKN